MSKPDKRSDWQVPPIRTPGNGKAQGNSGAPLSLKDFDPAAKPYSSGDKSTDKAAVVALAQEINALQDLFYADGRFKLLVVLQGIDTAGKDGTVRAVGWKAPTSVERGHDYLWRIHAQMPHAGEVVVFNRSHYEDVLVPVVNGDIDERATQQRYAQINDFERLLTETGTVVLKFMLHISFDEQRARLQSRVDEPSKRWKFSFDDLTVRQQWKAYQRAYEALLGATSTEWAPWTVVPADSKTHRNLMIATLVRDQLKALKLRYPPDDPRLAGLKIE